MQTELCKLHSAFLFPQLLGAANHGPEKKGGFLIPKPLHSDSCQDLRRELGLLFGETNIFIPTEQQGKLLRNWEMKSQDNSGLRLRSLPMETYF